MVRDHNRRFSSYRRHLILTGYAISVLLFFAFSLGWHAYGSEIKTENIGDYIGAATSSLALVWLLIGIYLQGYEISLQTQEMLESKLELARQAEAQTEQVSMIKEQARIVVLQLELSKVATAQALYENLLVDLAREIRAATNALIAYDSEQHITHLEESRKSGNLREYVDTFYLDLLGVPKYDLVNYIDWITDKANDEPSETHQGWRISDTKRLSFALCVGIVKNLRSIAKFNDSISLLNMKEHQTYDFLEHVLASLSNLRYISQIWFRLNLPMSEMEDRIVKYANIVDTIVPTYIARINEYPDWQHWGVLKNISQFNGILELWRSTNYLEILEDYPYVRRSDSD